MGIVRFPALLVVLLYSTVDPVANKVIKMDKFSEVVDYNRCRDEMLQIVTKPGGLLQRELKNNKDFKSMWKSNATCKKKFPGGTPEHMAALKSYADASRNFHKLFNTQLYKKGQNITIYQDEFPFKSLYFLLTDAMQLLSKGKCQTVYSATEDEDSVIVGDLIRFGSFFSAKLKYSDISEDTGDDGGTVFNITSCSVVNLDENGCESEEFDLLISPTEAFRVKNTRTVDNENEKFTQVDLVQFPLKNPFNCTSLFSLSTSDTSSSNLLSSSFMTLMAPFVMVYTYVLAL